MAKNGNNKVWLKLLVTIGIALLGVAVAYGMLNRQVVDNATDIETVKTEGCLPARQSETDIQLMQKDIEVIQEGVQDIKKGVDELLKR